MPKGASFDFQLQMRGVTQILKFPKISGHAANGCPINPVLRQIDEVMIKPHEENGFENRAI